VEKLKKDITSGEDEKIDGDDNDESEGKEWQETEGKWD